MSTKLQSLSQYFTTRAGIKRAMRFALKKPGKALQHFVRIASSSWPGRYFDSRAEYQTYVREIQESSLVRELESKLALKFAEVQGQTSRGNRYTAGTMIRNQAFNIYAVIRKHRPKTVVETGVCNGFSTAVFLAALKKNGDGHLYSIDLPEFVGDSDGKGRFWEGKGGAVVPATEQSGWLVPPELRDRWSLTIGRSQDKLAPLLTELKTIDLFVHDSEHSFENQMLEFQLAFQHLAKDGHLFASDLNWSDAFETFWRKERRHAARSFIDHSLAVVTRR